jgi:small subunit ribosomal protein S6
LPDNLYEAMFVVDAAKGGSEFPATIQHVAGLLTRNGATIQRIERWDERKLAYPIGHSKRGIYILVFFTSDGSAVGEIRRAVDLSEEVLRLLVLRAEQPSPVRGQLFSPDGEPVAPEEPKAEPATDDTPAAQETEEPEAEPATDDTPAAEGTEEAEEAEEEA